MISTSFARLAAVFSASVILTSIAGCAGETERSLIDSAKTYLAQSDTKAGIIQLKAALQRNPQSGEARFLLGKALLESGDAQAAGLELQKALDLKHDDNDVLPVLARVLLQQRDAKQVIAQYSRARLQDPVSIADLKTSIATAYLQLNDGERAQAAIEEAISVAPEFAPALLLKARLLGAARNFEQAASLCDRVLAKEPKNAEALTIKGSLALFTSVDRSTALALFRKALDADPRYLPAHMNILAVYMEQRDTAKLETQIEALRKVLPNHPQTKFFEAQLHYMRDRPAQAREVAQLLLRIVPDNVRILQLAGAIELQDNKLLRAEQHLGKAVQLAPDLILARRLLAQTYLNSGQADKALNVLAPLLTAAAPMAESLALAAEAHLLNGDVRQAEQLYARAAKINPNNPQIRTALALRKLVGGQSEAAFSELEAVASSDAGTLADMALISARMRAGDLDQALRAIDILDAKQPKRPVAAYLRGRVLTLQKKSSLAAKSYERALAIEPSYFPAAAALAALDLADAKPEQARQRFESILKVDAKHTMAMLALGELRERAGGAPEDVRKIIAEAARLSPTEPAPRVLLIRDLLVRNETKAALSAAQDAVATIPSNPQLLALLGQAQFKSGDAEQALLTFRKLVALEPRAPNAYLQLADVQLAVKNRREAEQTLGRLLDMEPNHLDGQRALIALLLEDGRQEAALRVARDIQKQRPKLAVGWLYEGDVYARKGQWAPALTAYRIGLQRERIPQLAAKVHGTLVASGQLASADQMAQQWEKEFPKDVQFLIHLGDIALLRADHALAERRFRAVLELQPENPLALNNLAYMLLKQNKPGALVFAEKANQLAPDRPALMDTLSLALAAEGQFARAIEIQRRALSAQPEHHALRLTLAKLYLQAGDKSQARTELQSLASLGPKFANQAEVSRLLASL